MRPATKTNDHHFLLTLGGIYRKEYVRYGWDHICSPIIIISYSSKLFMLKCTKIVRIWGFVSDLGKGALRLGGTGVN